MVVTHGVFLESIRQTRSFYSSTGVSGDEVSEPFEDMLAELQDLPYDRGEADRFATDPANIPLNAPE